MAMLTPNIDWAKLWVAGEPSLKSVALQARRDAGYRWLGQAALHGNADARRLLGVDSPTASSNKMATTLPQLSEAAQIMDPLAGSNIETLRKSAFAGDSTAEYQLAMRYRDGAWGVEADQRKALAWLKLSANHGNTLAMSTLASAYNTGAFGLNQDAALAASWRERAEHAQSR